MLFVTTFEKYSTKYVGNMRKSRSHVKNKTVSIGAIFICWWPRWPRNSTKIMTKIEARFLCKWKEMTVDGHLEVYHALRNQYSAPFTGSASLLISSRCSATNKWSIYGFIQGGKSFERIPTDFMVLCDNFPEISRNSNDATTFLP